MRQDIRVGHRHGLLRKVPGTVILLAVLLIAARFRIMVIAWTLFGMLDLISAVTLGVLASGTPIGLLAGDVSTRVMGQFPLKPDSDLHRASAVHLSTRFAEPGPQRGGA